MSLAAEIGSTTAVFYFNSEEEAMAFREAVEFCNVPQLTVEGIGELFNDDGTVTWFVDMDKPFTENNS